MSQFEKNLQDLLQELGETEKINRQDIQQFMNQYLVTIPESPPPLGAETLYIIIDEQNAVEVATSVKIPNLKFKLGELLLEIANTWANGRDLLNKPFKLFVFGLRLLHRLKQLSTIEIHPKEAVLLVDIFKLTHEEKKLTIDNLKEYTKSELSASDFAKSLEKLEKLDCISLNDEQIRLNEILIIRRNS